MEVKEQINKIKDYIEIGEVLINNKIRKLRDTSKSCKANFIIDYTDLIKYEPDLADGIIENPEETLKIFEKAIEEIRDDGEQRTSVKPRFTNVDKIPSNNIRIRDIRVDTHNKMKVVNGVIKNVSNIYVDITSRRFECPVCGNIINVIQERFGVKKEPTRCGCGRKGKFIEMDCEKVDSQKLVIEEDLELLDSTQQPNKLDVILQYGLTSKEVEQKIILGARVSITGIILPKAIIQAGKETNELEAYMESNFIKSLEEKYKEVIITEEDKEKIIKLSKNPKVLEILTNSFAPNIYGYDEVKKALILQTFGGVRRFDPNTKEWERGDSHILLIGDPGTAKTKLGKAIEHLALKYKYCSGTSSSKAGLTYMVEKDDFIKTWTVEAGAVVLANGGTCVIDEIDKMDETTTNALHSTMEEQAIEVDKANIHRKLTTKTKILTCANWKGSRFNKMEPIYTQMNLPDSLISRFDLFFKFIDIPDKERDIKVMMSSLGIGTQLEEKERIDYELFHKYVIYASNFEPAINENLMRKVAELYADIRAKSKLKDDEMVISITARQGHAFRRLMESHARICLRDCNESDLEIARQLIEFSLREVAGTDEGNIDIDMIETGISSEKRHLINEVRRVINELSTKFKEIPIDEIFKQLSIHPPHEIEKTIDDLKFKYGEIFEPRRGFLMKL